MADPEAATRWHLEAPLDAGGNELDARIFSQCSNYVKSMPLKMPLRRQGDQVDFNFGDFDIVVTPAEINAVLEQQLVLQVQRIQIEIESCNGNFEILNVLDSVKCIDEQNSEFIKWTEGDGRPEKTGKFRMITHLLIDAKAANSHHLFRIAEWPIALIASEDVKTLFEEYAVTGVVFDPVA